jgi:protein SCO1/2
MQALRVGLWLLVAIALFALGAFTMGGLGWRDRNGPPATASAGTPLGGAFTLVDQKGEPVTEAIFRSKPTAAFFGYTHCPDVCPTTLMDMTEWMQALGSDVDKLRFVFVTVDPERDTPEVMNDYVSAFSDRIIGVTGEPDKVHAMVKDYKIFSRKVPLDGGDYSMDHTASVLLLNKDGVMVGTIDREEKRDTAVAKLRRLVAG